MTQESKEAEQGTLVVVEAAWGTVGSWAGSTTPMVALGYVTCPGCSNKFYGLNALITTMRPNF